MFGDDAGSLLVSRVASTKTDGGTLWSTDGSTELGTVGTSDGAVEEPAEDVVGEEGERDARGLVWRV